MRTGRLRETRSRKEATSKAREQASESVFFFFFFSVSETNFTLAFFSPFFCLRKKSLLLLLSIRRARKKKAHGERPAGRLRLCAPVAAAAGARVGDGQGKLQAAEKGQEARGIGPRSGAARARMCGPARGRGGAKVRFDECSCCCSAR